MFVNDNDYEDISEKAAKQKKAVHTKFEVVHCSRQLLVRTVRLLMVMFSLIKTLQRHCISWQRDGYYSVRSQGSGVFFF